MQDNDAVALQNLEHLMTEFFSPETTNERKRIIERSFQEFAGQIDSWRPCLHFLSSTNNHYVSMFALSTLETTIGRRWPILPWEDRALTRSTLYTLSLERGVAPFVRNKVVKLVVDIARHDWPHFYPDFYSNILQLLSHKHTRLLGLIYLRTASEELATPREDLPIQRKNELFRFLSAQVPLTLDSLTVLLKEATKLQSRSGTVTPPPSPTSGQTVAPARAILDVEGLATGTSEVCIATLDVLAHLFSWIELSEHISTNLLDAIFTCARYHDSMNGKQIEMAVQAVTTINELLYRPLCSPDVTDRLLVEIFQNGVTLFQFLERLDSINESYMEKLTEFLQLFVTNHLKRVESCPKFPVNTLLEVLCHHTFQQCSTVNGYLRCLDVWTTLLESTQSRYSPVSLALAERVLQKMSFKLNTRTLKDLDTESLDENEETEWQHFLRCNIECLAKIADISPIPIFTLLYRSWREGLIMFGELGAVIANNQVILLNESEASNVHAHLRDLASTTQALARLYSLFLGDDQSIDQSLAEEVVSQTLDACKFAKTNQLYKASLQPAAIVIDLIEVHSQLLASLQAWCHWIANRPEKTKESLCQRCIDSCILALDYTTFCDNPPPANLTHSATHLFQSITAMLKPVLWDEPTFRKLISMVTYPFLKPDTIKVLRRALVNAIVLPHGDGSIRERLLGTMVSTLSIPLGLEGQLAPSESTISITVVPLTQLLEDCSASSTTIKKMLHSCLGSTINRILELLPYMIRCQSVCEILLSFLHSVFSVLQQQLGPEFTQNAVQRMLYIYTRENISAGPALDQLLEILILVVSAPSNAFKAFVPSVTNLCLGQVWPAVGNDLSAYPDTTLVLLKLFHSILMHRWQYFYNTSILRTLGHTDEDESVEHKEELVAILEAFGQALLQPDVNIFRQSLQSLEQLNVRWRLYQRAVFKVHLLERFLMALFTVLFQQSHNLLADEIATAIHSLASVNIAWFFGHFLPTFLASCEGVDDMQKATLLGNFDKSTDQPTLTRSVLQLISDLRCYQFCRPG
ncbi:exportin-6-A isoform X1 [Bombus impatiens]|uniref:Exportin-6-A isoform X1 n=1 Tax=Bombus impatiens TaxID=132113 RepID=A0A6P6F778_BOMIM|nr:exportin-6-A isoform X1 [Bombus impatiens]